MKKIIFSFALLAMIFASCTKEGPVGPAGSAGTNGLDGTNGTNGTNGNANVTSGTATISNWIYDSNYKWYTATIIVNGITQAIVDNGVVMVYLYGNGANIALPTTVYPSSSYSETLSFYYGLQQVGIRVQDSDLTQPNYPGTLTFRVITIAGATLPNNIDLTNYSEVAKYFNIK